MLQRIQISGLGPHDAADLALDPMGVNTIAGPSQCGKSSLLLALTFCLWGEDTEGRPFPVEAIRDGKEWLGVQLTLANGTTFKRVMNRSRTIKRHKRDEQHGTEKAWRAQLGALGKDPDLLRLIMVPFGWQGPLAGPGGGRPLRDLLTRILPQQVETRTVVAELMAEAGARFKRDADPVDEATATTLRKEARRSLDQATGKLEAYRETLAVAQAERIDCPPDAEVDRARAIVAAGKAWTEYRTALARFEETVERNARAAETAEAWRQRKAALGDRPAGDDTPVREARKKKEASARAVEDARARLTTAREALAKAEAALRAAQEATDPRVVELQEALAAAQTAAGQAHDEAKKAPADDTCPTCHRDGWEEAAAERARLQAAADEARAKVVAATKALQEEAKPAAARKAEAVATAKAMVAEAESTERRCATDLDDLRQRLSVAEGELEQALSLANDPGAQWDAAVRALGVEPKVPQDPERPKMPTGPEPTDEEVAAATQLIERATEARGKLRQRAQDIERGTAAVASLEAEHAVLTAEVDRLEALVDAVRKAPSEVARRNLEQLGDLGPVEISLEGQGVAIKFDGRPWWLASRGRQIVCDLWFRAALRRAMRLPWLPIVVDSAQDWSGAWPSIPGPIWLLRTEPGEEIRVVAGAAEEVRDVA